MLSNKLQNQKYKYEAAVQRLHDLGIMINGSFVFGLDNDDKDVFKRTVDWGCFQWNNNFNLSCFKLHIRELNYTNQWNKKIELQQKTGLYMIQDMLFLNHLTLVHRI